MSGMAQDAFQNVSVDQLAVGLYVYLDLGWMDHPFPFNQFKIRDAEQIRILRSLGKKTFRCDPAKSDVSPNRPAAPVPQPAVEEAAPVVSADSPAMVAKLERIARIQEQRAAISACEKTFHSATATVKNLTRNLLSRPEEAVKAASELVGTMVASMLTDRDIAIHLMNDKVAGEEVYLHSLNVSVLAMILGKEMKMSAEQIHVLGMGALFHDIGKLEIPDKVLLKTQRLTHAEQELLKQHVAYGLDIGKRLNLPKEVLLIIAQHHEAMDGTGYPSALASERIILPARLIALINSYDNLCNPLNINDAITPHEALSLLFSKQRKKFDNDTLNVMVRSMGVYPPGTVVTLSNEAIGMVMAVNSSKPLKPSVLLYDGSVPKEEAMIVDLENEPDINVSKALRPAQLPRQIFDYLSPRKRTTYYFDAKDK